MSKLNVREEYTRQAGYGAADCVAEHFRYRATPFDGFYGADDSMVTLKRYTYGDKAPRVSDWIMSAGSTGMVDEGDFTVEDKARALSIMLRMAADRLASLKAGNSVDAPIPDENGWLPISEAPYAVRINEKVLESPALVLCVELKRGKREVAQGFAYRRNAAEVVGVASGYRNCEVTHFMPEPGLPVKKDREA